MATITGTTSGVLSLTQTFKTGGLQLSYWNDSSKNRTGYLTQQQVADLVAATTDTPSNLLELQWPDPETPASGSIVKNTYYTVDNERSFRLETRSIKVGSDYMLALNLDCYYNNNMAAHCNTSLTFNATQWAQVISNTGIGMLNSFSILVSNPVLALYSFPVVSPSEEYSDYSEYTKGYSFLGVITGTYISSSGSFSYQAGGQGQAGTDLTYVDSANAYWLRFLWDIKEPKIPTSEPDETFGGYDNDSDSGSVPGVPGVDMVLTGLVRLYEPTAAQMVAFSDFLWSTNLSQWDEILQSLKQWFSNPLESVVSVNIMPVDYFYDYDTGTSITPSSASIIMAGIDTGCVAPPCGANFKQVDCGTINLVPYFKSFLDCNPYTKYTIFLPYIGFREIDSNVLYAPSGANLHVVYNVDLITGCFTCFLHITKENAGTELDHILYTFSGNMATQVPLSASNVNDFIRTAGTLATAIVATAATGAVAGPGAMATAAKAGAAASIASAASSNVNISHGGNVQMESGYLGIQYPYLIVERPRESFPDGYLHTLGKPSDVGGALSDFPGFTVVKECHLDGVPATEEEKAEIMRLLQEGVIV